ncbi:MAG: hypothetical protein CM1200mP12_17580 [Gammaproteobacteria bacterium]|nr:MAG: hypothetical protein CM1200mP12_17580 [Gammaproteobacteria bacterium]
MAKALEGLSVVDISGSVSTEYCSKIFSDYGAEVINLEPESGFETRKIPPFISGKTIAPCMLISIQISSASLRISSKKNLLGSWFLMLT